VEAPPKPERGKMFETEAEELRGHKLSGDVVEKEGYLTHSAWPKKSPAPATRSGGTSRNRITLLKHLAEESARARNAEKLQEVVDRVIELALIGDTTAMTLVWKSVMTNGAADDKTQAREKVEINITSSAPVRVAETIDIAESTDNGEQ